MARLVYGMMQSLDGYVDDVEGTLVMPAPDDEVCGYFTQQVRSVAGCLYGRHLLRPCVTGMRKGQTTPSWSTSSAGAAVKAQVGGLAHAELRGSNAALVNGDLASFVRRLKDEVQGDIDVAGPLLAGSLTEHGLIDEYRLYLRPYVLGSGKPYFAGPRPPLRLVQVDRIGPETVRLTYVPD